MSIEWSFNGKKISEDRIADEFMSHATDFFAQSYAEQFKSNLQRQIGNVVCPVHGKPPQITVTIEHNSEFEGNYRIDTCCQDFLDSLQAVLGTSDE
jgi:hypothetical protein